MIGKKISNFHINECLGEGGMGTVYKATDMHLNRSVAIKMLHPHMTKDPDAFKRFQNEAQLSARVSHPNVATLLDFQEADGIHYIVMEYVDGMPLDNLLKFQEKLSQGEAIKITLQILEGLEAAHDLGIMHRDLKPGNIMVSKRGYVKLMDFGIARLENTERMTRQNSVIGTLEYLSPELVKGGAPSKSSDLYAVGVMLYEMLAGRTLFEADTEATLMYNIAHKQAVINLPGVERRLIRIIKKLIHKQVSKRYQSIQEVLDELSQIHRGGRINTLLFTQKKEPTPVQGSVNPLQQILSNQKLPNIPKNLPEFPKVSLSALNDLKMPFDLDIRIIAGALGLSLLIVLMGVFGGSGSSGKMEEDPTSSIQAELLSDEGTDATNQTFPSASRQPQEIVVGELDGITIEDPMTKEKETFINEPKKHQIRTLEESAPKQKTQEVSEARRRPQQQETQAQPTQTKSSPSGTRVEIPETLIAAVFEQKISTENSQQGQTIYLKTAQATRVDNQTIIQRGARVKAEIRELVKAESSKKRAFMNISLLSVQAVNGEWLPLNHSGYSLKSRGKVEFPRGFQISKVKLRSGTIRLK